MIKEVNGDILLTKADAIAHGIAPLDDFKQGLARSLREQWPAMYKDFRHYCQTSHPDTGELWSWKGAIGPAIVNLFTQTAPDHAGAHPGRASVEAVGHCLKALKKEAVERGFKSVALTKLATGVGGLEWDEVQPLIKKYLSDSHFTVYLYSQYKKGQRATE